MGLRINNINASKKRAMADKIIITLKTSQYTEFASQKTNNGNKARKIKISVNITKLSEASFKRNFLSKKNDINNKPTKPI